MRDAATLLRLADSALMETERSPALEVEIGKALGVSSTLPYLSSLDAALTVVPPEHTVHLADWEHESLRARGPWMAIVLPRSKRGTGSDYGFVCRCQNAPTPAIALLCAALRATAYQLIPPPSSTETSQ